MGGQVVVRQVRSGGARLVEILSGAFRDDPWLTWTLPDDGARRSMFSLFLRTVAFPHGRVTVASRDGNAEGVAVAFPPGVEAPLDDDVGQMVMALQGPLLGRALDAEQILDRARADDGCWVLHTLGVAPGTWRRGVGSTLLHDLRARAAADGTGIAVETSSRWSRDFYLRHGFAVTATIDLRAHGLGPEAPTVWLLRSGVSDHA